MWEGGKLFLRAGKPSDDEAAAALDRVELRRDVFVAVVDAIKAHVDEKHGSISQRFAQKNRTGSSVFETSRKARSSKYWICGESTTLRSVWRCSRWCANAPARRAAAGERFSSSASQCRA